MVHGKVCLKIQWLYDSLLFFQKALGNQDESIKMYQEQLNVLQTHLKNYRAPFKYILDPRDEGVESSGIELDKQYIELMNDPVGR